MHRFPRLAAALAALAIAGCGGDDDGRTFTAEEFVSEMNERGADLVLGEPLETNREGADVFAVAFASESEPGATAPEHGGGSLTVTEDAEAGLAEYERCEAAASILCYRANNVVVLLAGDFEPAETKALESALRKLAGVPADRG